MILERVSPQDAVTILNELLECDAVAVSALVNHRIPCNQVLANHSTVQVSRDDQGYRVGLLGIINGLFGIDDRGWGAIAAKVESDGTVIRFELASALNKSSR